MGRLSSHAHKVLGVATFAAFFHRGEFAPCVQAQAQAALRDTAIDFYAQYERFVLFLVLFSMYLLVPAHKFRLSARAKVCLHRFIHVAASKSTHNSPRRHPALLLCVTEFMSDPTELLRLFTRRQFSTVCLLLLLLLSAFHVLADLQQLKSVLVAQKRKPQSRRPCARCSGTWWFGASHVRD